MLDDTVGLGGTRDRFLVPPGVVYLDGNSLGALPRGVPDRINDAIAREWGAGLIGSWIEADWAGLAQRVGAKLAPLLGTAPDDLHVGDGTSVSLYKALVAGCRLRPDRSVVVLDPSTFPTDAYVAEGVANTLGLRLRWADLGQPASSVDEDVAMVLINHVDFRTGAMLDIGSVTEAIHDAGAVVLWDVCHSVGTVPLTLAVDDVDFAVGCTYKYLNGGPGSPAFIYVAPRHQQKIAPPIPGWWGHARPFAMELAHAPAHGAARMASGTPPVLGLTVLDAALDVFADVDLPQLRTRSLSLTNYFIELVDRLVGDVVEVITPRLEHHRGSQVSLRHPAAYGVIQALIRRGVIGDFRAPDVARFGFAPLYVTHRDVLRAAGHLAAVVDSAEFAHPDHATRSHVT
ncbi:kynureninase [Nocardioides jensenii]|uniref:kynureninase n=1 Tax=Nocardioides jensenii TaxID=1843 RepID=UPI00082AABD0|nr:kynureninase [Nocardioides jensenii]